MRIEPKIVFNSIVVCTALGIGSVALFAVAMTSTDKVIQISCASCSPLCFAAMAVGISCLKQYLEEGYVEYE